MDRVNCGNLEVDFDVFGLVPHISTFSGTTTASAYELVNNEMLRTLNHETTF